LVQTGTTLVNAEMNIQVPHEARNFLTKSMTIDSQDKICCTNLVSLVQTCGVILLLCIIFVTIFDLHF